MSNISEGLEASLNDSEESWSGDMLNVANGDIFFQGEGAVQPDFSTLNEGDTTTEDITVSFDDLDSSIGTDTLAWMSDSDV
mgnify:FL=1